MSIKNSDKLAIQSIVMAAAATAIFYYFLDGFLKVHWAFYFVFYLVFLGSLMSSFLKDEANKKIVDGNKHGDAGLSRKCPFCAEDIKPEAIVCRHCKKDLPIQNHRAVSLSQDISEYIKQSLFNNRWSGTTTIHAGTYGKTAENLEGSFFADPNGTFQLSAGVPKFLISGMVKYSCGVFVPNDPASPPVIFTYHTTVPARFEFGVKPVSLTSSHP